jgi:hypothetical protein
MKINKKYVELHKGGISLDKEVKYFVSILMYYMIDYKDLTLEAVLDWNIQLEGNYLRG